MRSMPLILLWAVCLITLATSRAWPQDKIDKQTAYLQVVQAQFVKDKETEKQKVLNKFDVLIKNVTNNSKLKPADRLSLTEKLRSERKVFAEKEDLPENSDVVQAAWDYALAVVRKYKPVSTTFDQMMNAYIKVGKTDQAENIKADKDKFDQEHLPGRKHFTAGAEWTGTQYEGTNGTLFRFRIVELQGSVFKVRVEKNFTVGGHPIFEVSGSLDGILVRCARAAPIQGNVQLSACEGVVLGQTLILRLITVSRKGLATTSFAVLRKK
jgi:hypothetical protein